MKKIIIITIAVLALFTSCNLDNQGVFAEVIDRTPSDNRKLSAIGLSGDEKTLYFSSVHGIEAYDIANSSYETLDNSANARKISISFLIGDKIVYGVTKANQDKVEFTGFYLCDPSDKSTKTLTVRNVPALTGSWDKYAHDANGKVYRADLSGETLSFIEICSAPGGEAKRFVTRMDNIFVFTSDASSETPATSTLLYYLFNGTSLTLITGIGNPGTIRSVAKESDTSIIASFSSDNSSAAYRITGTAAKKVGNVVGSKISRNFASFVEDGYLYYAFDKSSSLYRMNLVDGITSSNTISKISNVAVVGYYRIDDTHYRVCTSNNGFFTLTISSDHSVTIN